MSAATPILSRIGYSMKWQHAVVISWGGLRGAVGLALALVVVQEGNSYPGTVLQSIGNHVRYYGVDVLYYIDMSMPYTYIYIRTYIYVYTAIEH